MSHLPLHLQELQSESISILRETHVAFNKPVMLYSAGKDSSVLLHLAQKAFFPAPIPFPFLHIDTTWKFREMIEFRDRVTLEKKLTMLIHTNPDGITQGLSPMTHGSGLYTDVMKTKALRQALDANEFDAAIGGARRDEEASRSKERIFSVRGAGHRWDPRSQRPEFGQTYNTGLAQGETMRVFPLSNWTELDIWSYIQAESIPVVPLYFAKERSIVKRGDMLIYPDDARLTLQEGETLETMSVRFRTLGCYPLTGAIPSQAKNVADIIDELHACLFSERQGRLIDHDEVGAME